MDLTKYKNNPKTAYLAKAVEMMEGDEEQQKMLIAEMDKILAVEESEEEFPNEAVLEVRAGAGGEEAALFAEQLARMYQGYAGSQGWSVRVLSESKTDLGGYKEAVFELRGKGVYEKLRFETGVHRIQRVPATEKSGRVHTSTASVAILPIRKKHKFEVNPADIEMEFSRAGGAGGQNVK
ncbi:MAG: Peptide chain release factor 1 [Parcubacteria group bacterium GW2011_GWA1_47_11]|nr:MAG: Peptide chain release factor 1 [Parcubacteria group bacterium GW2011_GWA1_47_11]